NFAVANNEVSSNTASLPSTTVRVVNGSGSVTLTPTHSGAVNLTATAGTLRGSTNITVNPSLYRYSYTLSAYGYVSDVWTLVARMPFVFNAQNDAQAVGFVNNETLVWAQELNNNEAPGGRWTDFVSNPSVQSRITATLNSKTAFN